MLKKYIVDLTESERAQLHHVVKKLNGSSQKVKRANILLKADSSRFGWTDAKIAESLDCRTKTVENVRKRFVEEGFELALNGKKREKPPANKQDSRWRARSQNHCDATGRTAQRLWEMDASITRSKSCRA